PSAGQLSIASSFFCLELPPFLDYNVTNNLNYIMFLGNKQKKVVRVAAAVIGILTIVSMVALYSLSYFF
ncbi:MAG TPA: hypothetical protein PLZ23_01920, partial [Candidatus Paceibacterota bacterium]|nr:hypothetical protein [Candidatus Paceibacterota bacterium]HQB27167.1 hypothetical protein [Candidatus Paceibacterota bacterium]